MNTLCFRLLIGILIAISTNLSAQHYPAGSEGIKGATMPSPGLYFEDDNSFYYSDHAPGFDGQLKYTWHAWSSLISTMKQGFKYESYIQAPRLLWMTDRKVFGADYGVAVKIPFAYKEHLQEFDTVLIQDNMIGGAGPTMKSTREFGISDIEVEPLILSWHLKQFDILAGYAFFAPSGDYDHKKLYILNLGNGYWTHMFTLGITWYPDADKSWAFSLVNHYEINMEQYTDYANPYLGIQPTSTTLGDIYTLEWAVSKTVIKDVNVGITGYFQQQVTSTDGPTWYGPTFLDERVHVAGIGPEIRAEIPSCGLGVSLRYAYEFSALDHPQGQMTTLTITKSF